MTDGPKTERLTSSIVASDEMGWQPGTKDGQNPVDAVLYGFKHGEVNDPMMMWPIVLAGYANITIDQSRALIEQAQATDPANWIEVLRANWP